MTAGRGRSTPADLDRSIARLLTFGTYVSVALLAAGVVLLLVQGISPLAGGPAFHPDLVVDDLVHLRPAGVMWLGLIAVIATPASRVVAALVGFAGRGEPMMAGVAGLILAVIALSVALARTLSA